MVNDIWRVGAGGAVSAFSGMRRDFKPTCFIISEIGEPGSPERARADRFYAIIAVALRLVTEYWKRERNEVVDLQPLRLDKEPPGDAFLELVMQNIIHARLVVAVLSSSNKNAHLECGIALAAARPLTLLVERTGDGAPDVPSLGGRTARERPRRHDVPSDLSNWPCIECDISTEAVDLQAAETLAFNMIQQLLRGEPIAAFERTFKDGVIGLRAFGKDPGIVYLDRAIEFKFAAWSEMLWSSRQRIDVAGTSLRYLCEPYRTWFYSRDLITRERSGRRAAGEESGDLSLLVLLTQRALFEGVRVRLFMLTDDNPYIEHLIFARSVRAQQQRVAETRDEIRRNVEMIKRFFAPAESEQVAVLEDEIAAHFPDYEFPWSDGGSIELIEVKRGPLYSRITLTDDEGFITPYHTSEDRNSGPAFRMSSGLVLNSAGQLVRNGLYAKVSEHLDDLYASNMASITRFGRQDFISALARASG